MSEHKVALPPDMPSAMRNQLKRDDVGRPIPFFVEYVDGKPDFRIMSSTNFMRAIRENLCWICGTKLTRRTGVFVAGPMCVINGTSAEPPSHYACARWSAQACPFLTKPAKERRETRLPEGVTDAPGVMIDRNPGVTALITSKSWKPFHPPGESGILFHFSIERCEWMSEGREATPDEVLESVETGIGLLAKVAAEEGHSAEVALAFQTQMALDRWFPPFAPHKYPTIAGVLEP